MDYIAFDFRPATGSDAAAIADIYNEAVVATTASWDLEPQSVEERERWLAEHADPRYPVLVAERDGRVVAWGSLSRWSERGAYAATVEVSTYVAEDQRGLGLGPEMTRRLIALGETAGVHAFIAQISADNAASLSMTDKLGFDQVGHLREVGYKFGRVLDVLIFEKLAERVLGEAP